MASQPATPEQHERAKPARRRRVVIPARERNALVGVLLFVVIGCAGIYVDDPKQLGSAWDQALASEIPVVLEVKTDPEVPPLPPHITLQQARNFSLALAKGDPNEMDVIRGAARQLMETILPGKD